MRQSQGVQVREDERINRGRNGALRDLISDALTKFLNLAQALGRIEQHARCRQIGIKRTYEGLVSVNGLCRPRDDWLVGSPQTFKGSLKSLIELVQILEQPASCLADLQRFALERRDSVLSSCLLHHLDQAFVPDRFWQVAKSAVLHGKDCGLQSWIPRDDNHRNIEV